MVSCFCSHPGDRGDPHPQKAQSHHHRAGQSASAEPQDLRARRPWSRGLLFGKMALLPWVRGAWGGSVYSLRAAHSADDQL